MVKISASKALASAEMPDESKKRKRETVLCPRCGQPLYEPKAKRRKTSDLDDLEEGESGNCVFTTGYGDCGQLGLGPEEEIVYHPTQVENLPDDICQVAAGGLHTVCVTSSGQVYSFGLNDEGMLGRVTDDESDDCCLPAIVPMDDTVRVRQVSTGDSHTVALSSDGRVFVWGTFRDASGENGLIPSGPSISYSPIEVMDDCLMVASGADHVVCLTGNGRICTFGVCEHGQLGRAHPTNCMDGVDGTQQTMLLTPEEVRFPSTALPFSKIWTGHYTTFAKNLRGHIYAWGLNNYGQLGFEDMMPRYYPEKWEENSDINWLQIVGGQHHTLALDCAGTVYSFGRNDNGQLGLGRGDDDNSVVTAVSPIPKLAEKTCVCIACGSSVSFAVTVEGTVYSWGMADGQLGLGDIEADVFVPKPVLGCLLTRKVLMVSSGGQHTVVLAEQPLSKLLCDYEGHVERERLYHIS